MGLNPCGRDSSPLLFVFFNKVLNYSATNLKADVPSVTDSSHGNTFIGLSDASGANSLKCSYRLRILFILARQLNVSQAPTAPGTGTL
jgi:hypothetical protein